jgi:hypothetical protein
MDRQTRRTYFERLCELRDAYGRLGTDDTTCVISIEAMITLTIRLLERPASPLIVMLDQGAQSA